MARTYKRTVGAKVIKNYSRETLLQAIQEIKEKQISLNSASKKYGIPKGTLSLNVKKQDVLKAHGGQKVFSDAEEVMLCNVMIKTSEWGFPLTYDDLRYIAKGYLQRQGRAVPKFKNNLPGPDWASSFFKRHKDKLTVRKCANITPKRGSVDKDIVNSYFDNIEKELQGIPPENVFNFDETNVSDNPGTKKCIFKRGVKYPERIMGHSKTSISLMFCGSAAGNLLPIYTVYKGENLWSTWAEGGPPNARYNRTPMVGLKK